MEKCLVFILIKINAISCIQQDPGLCRPLWAGTGSSPPFVVDTRLSEIQQEAWG